MEVDREMKLSRKRSQQLDGMSTEFKRMFVIESQSIVEITDSPPRLSPPVDDSDQSIVPQTPKVRSVFISSEKNNDDLN